MKLLYCRSCRDMVKLIPTVRHCRCAKTSGKMDRDMHRAETWGRHAEVIGMGDTPLMHALAHEDLNATVFGLGPEVKTWIYPHNYEKITRNTGTTVVEPKA